MVCAAYLARRPNGEGEEDAVDRGMPMKTARVAAREKLSREVMEMTADVKQRLKALRTMGNGACSSDGVESRRTLRAGAMANSAKRRKEGIYRLRVRASTLI